MRGPSMRVFPLTLVLCAMSSAQDTTGTIEGRVLDPSGRVITGAVVRATNTSTGYTRRQHTSSSGGYDLSLQAAAYDILVEAPEFARLTQKDVQLNVSQTARIDFSLTIVRDKEVVAVTAEVPTVQTSSNEIGNAVTGRELIDLPLNGRNFTQLGSLQPGVAPLTAGLAAGADRKPSGRRAGYRQQGCPSASHDRGKSRRLRPGATSDNADQRRLYAGCHGAGDFASVGLITNSTSSTYHAAQTALSRPVRMGPISGSPAPRSAGSTQSLRRDSLAMRAATRGADRALRTST